MSSTWWEGKASLRAVRGHRAPCAGGQPPPPMTPQLLVPHPYFHNSRCSWVFLYFLEHAQPLGCVRLFVTPWTVACQAPLSVGLPRQKYWSGLPVPPPGDFPDPGIKPLSPMSPALQADSLPLCHLGSPCLPG